MSFAEAQLAAHGVACFVQSSPLLSSVVRMEFGREVFHDGLEPLDASRLAQGEKVRCATPAFHSTRKNCSIDRSGKTQYLKDRSIHIFGRKKIWRKHFNI